MTTQTHPSEAPKKPKYTLWSFFDHKKASHRNVLSLAIQYGWSKEHPVTGKEVADLGALDKWLRGKYKMGQSPVLKPLMEMTREELSKVIVALDNMVLKKHEREC